MRISLNASTKDISQVITTSDALCVDLKALAEHHISSAEAFAVKAKDRYAFAAAISPTGVTLKREGVKIFVGRAIMGRRGKIKLYAVLAFLYKIWYNPIDIL